MAGSPWGNSRYPPFAAQYAPPAPGPSFDPRRKQYGQPPPAGFYNPAILAQQPGASADYRAYAPPPTMPQPQIPSVLTPGAGHRTPSYPSLRSNSGDLPDLFFTTSAAPSFPTPQVPHMPHYPSAPQIRQTVSAPAPPVPRKPDFSHPPLPPKPTRTSPPGSLPMAAPGPSRYPERKSSVVVVPGPQRPAYPDIPQSPDSPLPMEEDQAFKVALEQSARDAEAARRREDEELARAMAESMSMSSLPVDTFNQPIASGSRMPHSAPPTVNASPMFPPPAFVQSPEALPINIGESTKQLTSSPPSTSQQILDDEALARRLAEEDAEVAAAQTIEAEREAQPRLSEPHSARPPPSLPLPPPEYSPSAPGSSISPAISPSPNPSSLSPPVVIPGHSRQPSPARDGPPSPEAYVSRRSSANAVPQSSPPMHEHDGRAGRSQSFGAYSTAPSLSPRPPLPHASSTTALRSSGPSPQLPAVPETPSTGSPPSTESSNSPSDSPPSAPSSVATSTSQYVDSELLRGVTIGFGPPAISAVLSPFEGPIPNVIALPYGRAPPLHIKAPNWRGMLKLMARLSNTRLEPTVEAMAVVKTTMHLRVVVNFVKVHQSSNDWHVILYMTIDHPVPENHRYHARNTNDPALLPYSYTLSPTPVFLRESADGPLSKWYSVPATAQNPYPALPMAFPDLATYLMTALEDSRRVISDRSSGGGRLAKAVDMFYPNHRSADDEPEERRGLTDRVRGLFGRGSRANRPANDDRSDLVTPFFADDFGR